MSATVAVGFFGKLPSRGDFLRAGLSRGFTDPWDAWLQRVLPACRHLIGAEWDEVWCVAPAWRFALAGGQVGRAPVVGLFLPSTDRAGRHFPLTIAAEGAESDADFLDAVEQAGRDAIGQIIAPDLLLARLLGIAPPAPASAVPDAVTRWWRSGSGERAGEALAFDVLPDAAALAGMLAR